jgi:hypothetical protein
MPGLRFAWLVVAACSAHAPAPPAQPVKACSSVRVRVVDEAGFPIAGARVHGWATVSRCGPSGPLEGCSFTPTDSPIVATDAAGSADVCDVADGRPGRGFVVVEYADWPTRIAPVTAASSITIGPPRSVIVEVPDACDAMKHLHVRAQTDHGEPVWGIPILGGMRSHRYRLDQLGPWQYWISSSDDRSGNSALERDACPAFIRTVDAHKFAGKLVLDRSDALIDMPELAGARATVRAFGTQTVMATATLDSTGRATIALPTTRGSAFCLRVDTVDRCVITYARAGEIATAGLYAGRERDIAASCGQCD